MSDLGSLLGLDLWPWLRNTVTIGSVAGVVILIGRWAIETYRKTPMLDYDLRGDWLYLKVSNRAPAQITVISIFVEKPDTVKIRENRADSPFTNAIYPRAEIPEFLTGSSKFPVFSSTLQVTGPPGCKASIRVAIRARNLFVIRKLLRISITLPKAVPTK